MFTTHTHINDKTPQKLKTLLLLGAAIMMPLSPAALGDDSLEEVLVTGSYIKSTADNEALPVQIIDNSFISAIGANTVADIIGKLAINTGSENAADSFTQGGSQGTSNVNLRGLGLSSTLVLINGRRQTFSGAIAIDGSIFVDSSSIPVDALERVEVLKEGASSTYGSDAIAGVVNYILKKDYRGFDINISHQEVDDGGQRDQDIGFSWGFGNDQTSVLIGAHYLDRTALSAASRPELVDNAISSLGNSFLLLGDSTVTDGPYQGQYFNFQTVPDANCEQNDNGVIIPGAFGASCGFRYGPLYNLVNREIRSQVYGNINHDINDDTELLFELGYSRGDVKDNPQSPSFPDLSFPFISPTHPSNPFGTFAVWLGRPLGAGFESPNAPRENRTLRSSLSLNGAFNDNWQWDTALTYSKNSYTQFFQDTLRSRLDAGLIGAGGPNNDEYFDPFFPENNSATLIQDFSHVTELERTTDLLVADAVVTGDIAELAAGAVSIAAGFQWRQESLEILADDVYELRLDESGNQIPVDLIFLGGFSELDLNRSIFAAFSEIKIPLTEALELNAAVRYEALDSDNSIDPKLALRWQLSDMLTLRASASTAFREASLTQQYANTVTLNGIQDFNADGTAKSNLSFVRVNAAGSTDLKPERSNNYNVGAIFSPTARLSAKLDLWQVDYTDLITVENAQGKLQEDLNGADILRDAFGTLTGINVEFFNSSKVNVEGIDIEIDWAINDQLTVGATAAHFLEYEITLPNGQTVDAAGYFNSANFARSMPKTKANAFAGYASGNHLISGNVSYISSYDDRSTNPDGSISKTKIDSFTTIDMQYSYDWQLANASDTSVKLTLGLKNAFDEMPPRVNDGANLSYDPKQHSPLGRVWYTRLNFSF